jgi:hypothetical protein
MNKMMTRREKLWGFQEYIWLISSQAIPYSVYTKAISKSTDQFGRIPYLQYRQQNAYRITSATYEESAHTVPDNKAESRLLLVSMEV